MRRSKVEPEASQAAQALTPDVMAMIGRALLTSGNSVWAVKVRGGEIRLDPIADWTITGEPDESTWRYTANRAGPSRQTSQKLTSARVIHVRIGTLPAYPWRGRGPLEIAASSSSLAARIEEQLAEEASGPVGGVVPVPRAANTDDLATRTLKGLKGQLALVDSARRAVGAKVAKRPPARARAIGKRTTTWTQPSGAHRWVEDRRSGPAASGGWGPGGSYSETLPGRRYAKRYA